MNRKELTEKLAAITPQIVKLELAGKSRYVDNECGKLWKEARHLQYLIKNLPNGGCMSYPVG